jgi:hypothetical protein
MKFILFSKIPFEVTDPIALIESYCFQNDFYVNFDLIEKREIIYVNSIGARTKSDDLPKCESIIRESINLPILGYKLDGFLDLTIDEIIDHVSQLQKDVMWKLLNIKGIGFSKATKILHTLFPEIMPMIDNPLQFKYIDKINPKWTELDSASILIDYYENLQINSNRENLRQLYTTVCKNGIPGLTMLRVFDILWWSYLKAEDLGRRKGINWTTIKPF